MKKAVMVIIVLAFLIGGCTVDIERNEKIENSETLNIGLTYPFSLDSEIQLSMGIELAVKEINMNGGIKGKQVNLIRIDDEGSVPGGMKAAQRYIDDRSIAAVIGPLNSRVAMSVAQVYNSAGLVMITPGATSPYLMKPDFKYIFRTIPNEEIVMEYLMGFIRESGYDKVAVYYADDDFGEGVADSVEKASAKLGIEVVDRTTNINGKNIKGVTDRWKAFDCEILVMGESFERAYELVKLIKSYKPEMRILGTTSFDYPKFIEYLGEYSEGAVIPTHFAYDSIRYEVTEFINSFREEYGKDPDLFAAVGYDTLKILCRAIENSVDFSGDSIARELHAIKSYEGITGTVSCDEAGEFRGNNIFIKTVSSEKMRIIDYHANKENEM